MTLLGPGEHALALFRGKPFSGKTILASKLANVYSDRIVAVSKDVIAESLGLQRTKGVEYTREVRQTLYTTFRTCVDQALDRNTPIVIAEAPFSRQKDVAEFVEPFRSRVSDILVMTFLPSDELRESFISYGRCHPDGTPRDLIGFEQQDGSSGEFDDIIEIPGVRSVGIDMVLPFSAQHHLQRVTTYLGL